MKTRIMIKEGEYQLFKAGCMDPKIDAELLYCFLTDRDRVQILMRAECFLPYQLRDGYLCVNRSAKIRILYPFCRGTVIWRRGGKRNNGDLASQLVQQLCNGTVPFCSQMVSFIEANGRDVIVPQNSGGIEHR